MCPRCVVEIRNSCQVCRCSMTIASNILNTDGGDYIGTIIVKQHRNIP